MSTRIYLVVYHPSEDRGMRAHDPIVMMIANDREAAESYVRTKRNENADFRVIEKPVNVQLPIQNTQIANICI